MNGSGDYKTRIQASPAATFQLYPLRRLPILPRSRHRPVALTEGRLREKVNEIGVRLWTDRSFDEDREVGGRDTFDPIAHALAIRNAESDN